MSSELELKDMCGDRFIIAQSPIWDKTLLFDIYDRNRKLQSLLDIKSIIKLRNFLNEFIEEQNG